MRVASTFSCTRPSAGQHIALEAGRNVQHEGVSCRVHAGVHLLRVTAVCGEQRRVEGPTMRGDSGEWVLIDDGDGPVVQRLGHGARRRSTRPR